MKKWQYAMILGLTATCLVGCERNEGPAERVGKKIDNFNEDTRRKAQDLTEETKERAQDLKREIEKEIRARREQEALRRQQELLNEKPAGTPALNPVIVPAKPTAQRRQQPR